MTNELDSNAITTHYPITRVLLRRDYDDDDANDDADDDAENTDDNPPSGRSFW